jgi:hypothetical protein
MSYEALMTVFSSVLGLLIAGVFYCFYRLFKSLTKGQGRWVAAKSEDSLDGYRFGPQGHGYRFGPQGHGYYIGDIKVHD